MPANRPHPYWWVLLAACAAAAGLTALTGTPSKLPNVALGSTALFHLERVVAFFAAFLLGFVVLTRAWRGQLPSAISGQGVTYPSEAKEAAEAAKETADFTLPEERDPETEPPEGGVPQDILGLRLKFEAKLAYVAKILLADDGNASFVTVGSLNYDGYLTDDEARVATYVLTLRQEELQTLPRRERDQFLNDADRLVRNIRASVFFGLVRECLAKNQWEVEEIDAHGGPRPDLIAVKDERRFRIAPRFATTPGSTILSTAQERLEGLAEGAPENETRVVVLPDRSRIDSEPEGDPRVLKLKELKGALGLSRDPRSLG